MVHLIVIQDKFKSEEVIPTDGGGWQCNKNCCLLLENMRTSHTVSGRAGHDRMHNTPGIWSEAPNHLCDDKKFYCFKCPGTRATGMIDYDTVPTIRNIRTSLDTRCTRHTVCAPPEAMCSLRSNILVCIKSTCYRSTCPLFQHVPMSRCLLMCA